MAASGVATLLLHYPHTGKADREHAHYFINLRRDRPGHWAMHRSNIAEELVTLALIVEATASHLLLYGYIRKFLV